MWNRETRPDPGWLNCERTRVAYLASVLLLVAVAVCGPLTLIAQATPRPLAVPLPPMGWSSWNSFSNTVDSQVIMNQARAMVSSGMRQAGYQYINIDEGWWLGERDLNGNIVVDPKAWPAIAPGERPGDMSNIVRYVHSLGLKAGTYTDAGRNGCSTVGPDLGPSYPNTGSEGYYQQDFLQFAKWGFDYVKVDWCGGDREKLDPAVQYAEIARAIAAAETITGHRLYYSICNWGKNSPWTWAPNVGGVMADIWRTGGDIVDPIVANTKNSGRRASFKEVLREFDQAAHPEAQHTGFYNDPDMMVVGMQGLTDAQNRAHMSLWAMSGGPLVVGADLSKLSDADIAALTNPDVLSVDQDALGLQATQVAEFSPGLEVWSKPLSKAGERAVLLLNRGASAAPISVRWGDLGLDDSASATVRDLWARKDLGVFHSPYSASVPTGDAAMLLIVGSEAKWTTYKAAGSAERSNSRDGIALSRDHPIQFTNVDSRSHVALIRIAYINPGNAPRIAELRVNGGIATRIAFPPTVGAHSWGEISFESELDQRGAKNVLSFSVSGDLGPTIVSISLQGN